MKRNKIYLLALFCMLVITHEVSSEVVVLNDFSAHETELTREHKEKLGAIATEISANSPMCARVIGHSSEWRNISKEEYCSRSIARAQNAAKVLQKALKDSSINAEIITEEEAYLGSSEQCVGSPLIVAARCPVAPQADLTIVIGGRSIDQPLVDNMINSSSTMARANRNINRRVEIMTLGQEEKYQTCSAPLAVGMTESSLSEKKIRLQNFEKMMEGFPDKRKSFVEGVVEIAAKEVNLPILFEDFTSNNREFNRPIHYKNIRKYAKTNFYNHLRPIEKSLAKNTNRKPAWYNKITNVLSQQHGEDIDPYLALAILLRESGVEAFPDCRSCATINTAGNGGLDSFYSLRRQFVKAGLMPKSFLKHIKKSTHPGFKNSIDIPQQFLAAMTFSYVGFARQTVIKAIASVYYSDIPDKEKRIVMAEERFNAASPVAQRAWTQIAFGRYNYSRSFLKLLQDFELPLDAILDIPGSLPAKEGLNQALKQSRKELLRRTNYKKAKVYYNAIKIAVIAEAFQRTYETECETDNRTYPFLFSR